MSDGERAERRAGCVGTLGDPGPEAARSFAADAFERGALLTVFGRCTVSYDGRATSSLGPGERLVVSKPDGTTLVHSDAGQEPVSWLRPGSSRIAGLRDGRVALVARRESPA
ncbi:MAG: endonuclease NucS, partial [Halorientalis sp.]